MSTVRELKTFLNSLSDSVNLDRPLIINVEYGYGCSMVVLDVDYKLTTQYDENIDEDFECLSFYGEESIMD